MHYISFAKLHYRKPRSLNNHSLYYYVCIEIGMDVPNSCICYYLLNMTNDGSQQQFGSRDCIMHFRSKIGILHYIDIVILDVVKILKLIVQIHTNCILIVCMKIIINILMGGDRVTDVYTRYRYNVVDRELY